jgi:two-component system sensor histidine kinase KdpD
VLCVAAFDFMFVPPQWAFTVDDLQYLLTFAIMLAVALVISHLRTRERAEAAAHAALTVEAETERIRGTLLAAISHDLRTPLAVIAGASSSLVEGGERMAPAEREALAASIYQRARDTADLVGKVLQMTRLEAGAMAPERDWASIGEIAGTVLHRLAAPLASHRVLLEVPSDLPLLRVDAALIDQVLSNLMENAARHTPPGTLVRLRAQVRESEMLVSVEDYGPGLDAADLERVFAKFQRGSGAGGGGVGLGLAICRAIVRLHGGRAWAERLSGGGTAFRFTLPLDAPPPPPVEDEAATAGPDTAGAPR